MNITERFDALHAAITAERLQINLTDVYAAPNTNVDVIAIEGPHLDPTRTRTVRAIGLSIIERTVIGKQTTRTTNFVYLNRDDEGQVEVTYGSYGFAFTKSSPRDKGQMVYERKPANYDIPEHSKDIARETAFFTIEQLLQDWKQLQASTE